MTPSPCPWCDGKVAGLVHSGHGQLWWTSCGHLVVVILHQARQLAQLERPGV